jgi:hypothetical protein
MGVAYVVCKGGTGFVIVPTLLRCLVMIAAVGMGDIFPVVLMHLPRIESALRMLFAYKAWLML